MSASKEAPDASGARTRKALGALGLQVRNLLGHALLPARERAHLREGRAKAGEAWRTAQR